MIYMLAGRRVINYQRTCRVRYEPSKAFVESRFFTAGRARLGGRVDNNVDVTIKVGTSDPCKLSILHPPKPATDSPIIIFLRRGTSLESTLDSSTKQLSLGANATVVEIKYPLSLSSPHPVPIHSVLAGFDWIRKNLIHDSERTQHDPANPAKTPSIGVCGELIGGSLATTLALTECHNPVSRPHMHGIKAAVVGNPIVDWTGFFGTPLDPVCVRPAVGSNTNGDIESPQHTDRQRLTVSGITDLRNNLFHKPEAYFDPFASPLLFFRTPSSDLPIETNPFSANASDTDLDAEGFAPEPMRKRRSYRKYPPTGFDLLLPHMRVEVGSKSVLRDQSTELVDLMRRSLKLSENEAMIQATQPASRRLEVVQREGLGLWNANRVFEIGQWFGEVLRAS